MVKLGSAILHVIAEEHGVEEIFARISDPFWFQSLGCLIGFEWHKESALRRLIAT
jgi:hypothetical protein